MTCDYPLCKKHLITNCEGCESKAILDKDGYPTQEGIEAIKNFSGHMKTKGAKMDIETLIELLHGIWYYPDYVKKNGRYLELHTGGWSGNEEIINALSESMFWYMFWRKSERGGHYYFKLPSDDIKTIYLAGPIDGVTPEWALEWRKEAATALKDRYHILDPTEGKDLYRDGVNDTVYTPEYIVETDLAMIKRADILLVDWRKEYECLGCDYGHPLRVGTIMEIAHAKVRGKKVYTFGDLKRGYWLRYHTDGNFDTLSQALKYLKGVTK